MKRAMWALVVALLICGPAWGATVFWGGVAADTVGVTGAAGIGLAGGGQGKQIVETLIGKRQAKTRSSD